MLAVAVTVVALIAPSFLPLGPRYRPGSSAAAVTVLHHSAQVAQRSRTLPPPRPGQVVYLREVGSIRSSDGDVACGIVYERWRAVDAGAAGRVIRVEGVLVPSVDWTGDPRSLATQPGCLRDDLDEPPPPVAASGTWQEPSAAFVDGLPDDPRRLYARAAADVVRDGHRHRREGEIFVYLANLMTSASPYLRPQTKATALRAMALVPGVQDHGKGTDALGRSGVAIGGPGDGTTRLLVEPLSGEVLGEQGDRYTITRSNTVVGGIGERPAG